MHTACSSSRHGGSPHLPWEQTPLEQAPPWEQTPPTGPSGAGTPSGLRPGDPPQARSPSTSPLVMGLETLPGQIPLNFPLGCGPGDPPGQIPLNFPPWVWAWKPARHAGIPPPLLETCCKACWDSTCNACWDSTPHPLVDRMTDMCKNITFANFVCGR